MTFTAGRLEEATLTMAARNARASGHLRDVAIRAAWSSRLGCLALLGSRIPSGLRIFMLSLAITDDIGAILVVAIGYSSQLAWAPLTLGIAACFLVRAMAALGVRRVPVYFVVGGDGEGRD